MNININALEGKKLLCAVSGGADSMCMLHLLRACGIELGVAHYEHGIRGEESLRDAKFVERYCRRNKIPFFIAHGNVPAYARTRGIGLEEAARELRYSFLERTRQEQGYDLIATAHNADDNAETLLMNLIRGSGARGLSGIPMQRGNIVRPMLKVSREEIEDYVRYKKIAHVEDSSNQSDDYTRNLIRHQIMPVAKRINPRFTEAAARTAELMRRDEEALSIFAGAFAAVNLQNGALSLKTLAVTPPAVAARMLRQLMPGLSMKHVDSILTFARGEGYGLMNLPGHIIIRDQGRLYLRQPALIPLSDRPLRPGECIFLSECGLNVSCEICQYGGEVNDLFTTSYLKYENISSELIIGGRRDGDKIRPAGRGCSKTLKSLFMENKIPVQLRDSCPVIRDGQGILLVRGLAMDERAKPRKGDKVFKITFTEINTDMGEYNNAERY